MRACVYVYVCVREYMCVCMCVCLRACVHMCNALVKRMPKYFNARTALLI